MKSLVLALALTAPVLAHAGSPADECGAAIAAAERAHATPPGLLARIATVESGRILPGETQPHPWPWTIDADGRGRFFDSKAEAVAGVRQAVAAGARLVDVGCMQVDLQMHPGAFPSLEEALDPAANADYAAGLLRRLYAQTGSWDLAVGLYHSHTPWLLDAYRARVAAIGHGVLSGTFAPAYVRIVRQGRVLLATRGSAFYGRLVSPKRQ